jgi:hypothetical protein
MKKNLVILSGALAFHSIFWQQQLGINSLLFGAMVAILLWLGNMDGLVRREALAAFATAMTASALIVWNNNILSKVVWVTSLLGLIGFAHAKHIRSLFWAGFQGSLAFGALPTTLMQMSFKMSFIRKMNTHALLWIKYVFIPIILFIIFYILYYNSNDGFSQLSDKMCLSIVEFFSYWLAHFSLASIFFLLVGIGVTAAIYIKNSVILDLEGPDGLQRLAAPNRPRATMAERSSWGMNALAIENRIGLLSFASLNLLLLVVNLLDISNVWLADVSGSSPSALKNQLHDGTYVLLGSILLAMALVVYFFRGNLNFYQGNRLLKYLAYFWLAQNVVLVASVAMRNAHYISAYGLAYKRIGVAIFLAATLVGLLTMFRKVAHRKTLAYLMRVNGWAVLAILLAAAFVDWDTAITRYNLSNFKAEKVDYPFLIAGMESYKSLPLLWEQRESMPAAQRTAFALRLRKGQWHFERQSGSWFSWNAADNKQQDFFKHNQLAINVFCETQLRPQTGTESVQPAN